MLQLLKVRRVLTVGVGIPEAHEARIIDSRLFDRLAGLAADYQESKNC
jgi:hypothetical protein